MVYPINEVRNVLRAQLKHFLDHSFINIRTIRCNYNAERCTVLKSPGNLSSAARHINLAISYSFGIPSCQQEDEHARAVKGIIMQVRKVGLEATMTTYSDYQVPTLARYATWVK